jgi:hypothetical protein
LGRDLRLQGEADSGYARRRCKLERPDDVVLYVQTRVHNDAQSSVDSIYLADIETVHAYEEATGQCENTFDHASVITQNRPYKITSKPAI